jgi:hypothetical protein
LISSVKFIGLKWSAKVVHIRQFSERAIICRKCGFASDLFPKYGREKLGLAVNNFLLIPRCVGIELLFLLIADATGFSGLKQK